MPFKVVWLVGRKRLLTEKSGFRTHKAAKSFAKKKVRMQQKSAPIIFRQGRVKLSYAGAFGLDGKYYPMRRR